MPRQTTMSRFMKEGFAACWPNSKPPPNVVRCPNCLRLASISTPCFSPCEGSAFNRRQIGLDRVGCAQLGFPSVQPATMRALLQTYQIVARQIPARAQEHRAAGRTLR